VGRVRAAAIRGRCGKSLRPDRGDELPLLKEGAAADAAVHDAQRRSRSRRELARHDRFEQISPEVGRLDEDALATALDEAPDETLALLADMTAATDPRLRELARRLAGRLFLDLARRGPARPRGVGRLDVQRYRPDHGDLDLDASLDEVVQARAAGTPPDPDDLRVRGWVRPDTALCLIVDRSGSMGGRPLATAAVAAAAVASRSPNDYSVLAFGHDVVVAKSQDSHRSSATVVNAVLALRGFGTTDLAGALTAASAQLDRSRAGRRIAVLLSDCRPTTPGDVVRAGRALDELCIVAPAGDSIEAEALAAACGARLVTVHGPTDAARALQHVLADA
jgi:Mg-chelatase subunit ChlD